MDDLNYPEYRKRFYKQSHHIKQLLRELQTADEIADVYKLQFDIVSAVAKLTVIKCEDLDEYKSHMKKMLTDICRWGDYDGKKT